MRSRAKHRFGSGKRWLAIGDLAVVTALAAHGCAQAETIDATGTDRPSFDASNEAAGRDSSTNSRDSSSSTGGSAGDVGVDVGIDVGIDATADVAVTDAASDVRAPCQSPVGACVNALPAGWTLSLFAPNRSSGCPQDFTPHEAIANPMAGAGACDCSCTVGATSSCTSGVMQTRHGTTSSCTSAGVSITVAGSGCAALTGNLSAYFSATPPSAMVTCSAAPVTDNTKLTSTEARSCDVPDACREDVCNGNVPAGFSACVVQNGDVACPTGFGTKTLVGDGASLSCSPCTCMASATCTGGRISFFSDTACATSLVAFNVDGSCQSSNGALSIRSYTYTANVANPQCTANGPKTASVALMGTRTVCCK